MDACRHLMFAELSSASADIATDLAIPIIARGGLRAVTPSAIGAAARCTRQAVHQWFGGQQPLREVVAKRFTSRWCRWADIRVHCYGAVALLPESEEVRQWCRVWLALAELGARDPKAQRLVDAIRTHERGALLALLRVPGETESFLDGIHCLLEGLRVRLCVSDAAPGFDAARSLVEAALDATPDGWQLRGGAVREATGPAGPAGPVERDRSRAAPPGFRPLLDVKQGGSRL